MNATTSLIIANIAIWIGFAGYFIFLSKNQQSIAKRLETLKNQLSSD